MHISCPQGRRSPTACGDIFPGGDVRAREGGREDSYDQISRYLQSTLMRKKNEEC